ncbi:hypothetical protein C9426_27815 [Serratia sp. S1B]|nr:hypothetical protein C9426_27815 [Serratia sp. S1B]
MKPLSNITLLALLFISLPSSAYTLNEKLDYCAKIESWAPWKVISALSSKDKGLDIGNATSVLINRVALKENNKNITLGAWGDLYVQTIKITIPYVNNKMQPKIIITSSIISPEECSLSEPSYLDVTELNK